MTRDLTKDPVTVPVEMAVAACSGLALASIKAWLDCGARPFSQARVYRVGDRLMALIDFRAPVEQGGRKVDGTTVPLMVTLFDGSPSADLVERLRRSDALRDRLMAAITEHDQR